MNTSFHVDAPSYAGFWRRAGALSIDSLVVTLPSTLLTPLALLWNVGWADWVLTIVLLWLYYASFHASAWQATPGKRVFGIKVMDLGGNRISFARATGRYFATFLSTLLLTIGYLMAAFTERRQALHDKIVGTLVVDLAAGPGLLPASGAVPRIGTRTRWLIAAVLVASIAVDIAVQFSLNPYLTSELGKQDLTREEISTAASDPRREEIAYAIYSRSFFGSKPEFVKEGIRHYSHSEVRTYQGPAPNVPNTVKILRIADGYAIEASVYQESQVDGFGLTLQKDGGGFSWEWFVRESGGTFRKLQGPGQVDVRFKRTESGEEIAELLFLDDITMRLDRFWMIPFSGDKSDLLVIRKGSVLWLSD